MMAVNNGAFADSKQLNKQLKMGAARKRESVLVRPLGCCERFSAMPEELTVQVGAVAGPDGVPVILLVPTWSGPQGERDEHIAPLLGLGTLLDNTLDSVRYGTSLSVLDSYVVNGQRTFTEACYLPTLDRNGVDVLVEAMTKAVSAGCAIFSHQFKGAASRVPVEATAFGLRRDHVLIEILASLPDRSSGSEERRHQQWARNARRAFDAIALPGGYPNLLASSDTERAAQSFGPNVERLARVKQLYDPENVFCSAIPLPIDRRAMAAE